jgi:hypothetical protein
MERIESIEQIAKYREISLSVERMGLDADMELLTVPDLNQAALCILPALTAERIKAIEFTLNSRRTWLTAGLGALKSGDFMCHASAVH